MPIITIYQGASGRAEWRKLVAAFWLPLCGTNRASGGEPALSNSEAKLNQIWKKVRTVERLLQNMRPYRIALQGALCEIAAEGKIVYHGHLGHELLPGIRMC